MFIAIWLSGRFSHVSQITLLEMPSIWDAQKSQEYWRKRRWIQISVDNNTHQRQLDHRAEEEMRNNREQAEKIHAEEQSCSTK